MATLGNIVTGFRSAHDLGVLKALKASGKLTEREIVRIEPRLKEGAKALDENARRRAERLGSKVATLPEPEQHRYRDGFVRQYR